MYAFWRFSAPVILKKFEFLGIDGLTEGKNPRGSVLSAPEDLDPNKVPILSGGKHRRESMPSVPEELDPNKAVILSGKLQS